MTLVQVFRLVVVAGTASYIAYWSLPYTYGYLDPNVGSLLSYSGVNAAVFLPDAVATVLFFAWVVSAAGLVVLRKWARAAFVVLVVATTLISPLMGILVETGVGATLLGITYMSDGAILALAYCSPVKDEFR